MAIIGAGIGGLTLAIALRRRGIRAAVYERADELREVGAAVALSANGTRVLHALGLRAPLDAASTVPTELIYRHWREGGRVASFTAGEAYAERFGAPYCGVHRADLQAVLAEACGPQDLHLDHRLVGISTENRGHELEFANGVVAHADLVVGADGVHSTTRRWVADAEPAAYSGTSGFRGLIHREEMPSLPDPDAIQFWMGRARTCCTTRSATARSSTSSPWWTIRPPGRVPAGSPTSHRTCSANPSPDGTRACAR
ncbi:FAD-dependent monooxygenase [Saccharopolyspora sp. ID03-671]|uniref:FAD-dependent oxidoreductase n=1 Tax=Saccharopolyspora sp. ID03-671 TaxID=3073066 RepID=UPI003250CAD5